MSKNGTSYSNDTPHRIVEVLEAARLAHNRGDGYRLRIVYGDSKTGKPWGDHHSEPSCGYIGRTKGPKTKSLLLLKNRNSIGGDLIHVNCIVKIEHANKKNGGVLFDITSSVAPTHRKDLLKKRGHHLRFS